MPKHPLIISHEEDLDGIASNAVVRRQFGDQWINSDFARYSTYPSKLESIDREAVSELVITDMGLNVHSVPAIAQNLSRLEGIPLTYIDHHRIPKNALILEEAAVFVMDPNEVHTATELARLYYRQYDDKISTKLARLSHITDFRISEIGEYTEAELTLAKRLSKVIEADSSRTALENVSRHLSKGEFWNRDFDNVYHTRLELEANAQNKLCEQTTVHNVKNLKIAYAYSELFSAYRSAKIISKEYDDVGLYVGVTPKDPNVIIIRNSDSDFDVGTVCQDFGGGGHTDRGGFGYSNGPTKDGKISGELVRDIERAVAKYR